MLIFIDESGIHKKTDHSSFVLAYIAFQDYQDVEKIVIELEKDLGLEEFHWAETIWKVKEKFVESVLKLDFAIKAAVVKNPVNPEDELERLLSVFLVEKGIRTIFLDGKKPKWYARKIKKILNDKGIFTRKLKTISDKQYAGARIADMAAGLIRSHFDRPDKKDVARLYRKLEKKIIKLMQ